VRKNLNQLVNTFSWIMFDQLELYSNKRLNWGKIDNKLAILSLNWDEELKGQAIRGHWAKCKWVCNCLSLIFMINLAKLGSFNKQTKFVNIEWTLTLNKKRKLKNKLECRIALGMHWLRFSLYLNSFLNNAINQEHLSSDRKMSWEWYFNQGIITALNIYKSYLSITFL